MTKCWIDGIEYAIEDGHIINDKFSEELDSGIITIAMVDRLDLHPLDKVKLENERETKYLCVNTWTDEIASFNPLKYTYNIALISRTILLQKIVLPNISIKHQIGLPKKTIRKKLEEYYEIYIAPQYPELVLSQELLDLTNDVECPEMAFSRPTMYEVINGLLLTIGCVVRVVDDAITYYDLDEKGQEIDESRIYFENETQSVNDYADRLDVQVENAVSKKNSYATPFGISVRGHGPTLTDDNLYIELDKNIYDMDDISVMIVFPAIDVISSGSPKVKLTHNISDYVVEKSVYDTYEVSNDKGIIKGKRYKRNALYFTHGGNTIEGLSYKENWLLGETHSALWNIVSNVVNDALGSNWLPNFTEAKLRDNVFFYLQYKASDSFRLNVEKDNKHNATLIDNQSEQQVESSRFGKVEQDKLNRLGNKAKIINAVYTYDERIPELSDYIGRYILAQREIVYYDDFAIFKGYLYKDYIRKNYYYGLSSKKRFTQIPNDMIVRNDVINYNLSFQFDEPNDEPLFNYLKRYLLMPISSAENEANMVNLGQRYKEYPKYTFNKFYDKDGNDITSYGYIMVSPSFYSCGKSNVISIKMKDNYSAGIRSSYLDLGVVLQKYVPYVDDYGEFKDIEIELRTSDKEDFMNDGIDYVENIFEGHKKMADNLPAVAEYDIGNFNSNYVLKTSKRLYKDSSEITAITMNFNFMDSENIIVGAIADYTGIGHDWNSASGLKVCYSMTDKYEKGDIYGLGEFEEDYVGIDATDSKNYLNNRNLFNKLTIYSNHITGVSGWKSWGICDSEGNLIIGVNNPTDTGRIPTTIYLKCEKKDY